MYTTRTRDNWFTRQLTSYSTPVRFSRTAPVSARSDATEDTAPRLPSQFILTAFQGGDWPPNALRGRITT